MKAELHGATVLLEYPKIPEGIEDIKRIPKAKWNKVEARWEIPMTSFPEIREFCRNHRVPMSEELMRFPMPDTRRTNNEIRSTPEGLIITFPFDPQEIKKDELKKVPGVTYIKKTTSWSAPHSSLGAVIEWADKFRVYVPDVLRGVAKWQEVERATSIALSLAVSGVELDVTGITADLMGHQKTAIKYVRKHRRSFIADDMGLGKTLESIAAMEDLSATEQVYPILIVCPPKLGLNWKKEYEQFNPGKTIQVVAKKADTLQQPRADVTIVGHSLVSSLAAGLTGFRSLIVDESHAFKNPTAQRTRAMLKIAAPIEGPRLLLTGTPITIRPAEFVPQLKIVGLMYHFGDDHNFYTNYCDLKKGQRSGYDFSGASNLEALNLKLRSIGYVRRNRDDALDLPDVSHGDVLVPLEPSFCKEYDRAEADVVEYLVARAREIALEMKMSVKAAEVLARVKAEAGRHLVEISVLRQIAAKGKIDAAIEWGESRKEEGRPIIIAAHHREIVDLLADKFGGLKIQGGMSNKLVEEHKAKFQAGAPAIVVSMMAGSEGHTLTAARDTLFIELPWTSTTYDQLWGRMWRKGQTQKTTVTAMLAHGTLDVPQFDSLAIRRRRVKAATVGGEIDSSGSVVGFLLAKGLAKI